MESRWVIDREVKIKFSNVYAVAPDTYEAIVVLENNTELKVRSVTPELALAKVDNVLSDHIKAVIDVEREALRRKSEEEFYDKLWDFAKENYDLYLRGLTHGRTTCVEGQTVNEGRCRKCDLMALGRQLDWIGRDEFHLKLELWVN